MIHVRIDRVQLPRTVGVQAGTPGADYMATERAPGLIVKEFQTEGRARTALLVDTRGRWMFGGTRERLLDIDPFEAALSIAASVVDYLATTDRVLELLVAGPEVYRFVSAGRIGYLEEVMDILAAVEPMKDDPLERLEPMLLDEIRLIQSVCLILRTLRSKQAAD